MANNISSLKTSYDNECVRYNELNAKTSITFENSTLFALNVDGVCKSFMDLGDKMESFANDITSMPFNEDHFPKTKNDLINIANKIVDVAYGNDGIVQSAYISIYNASNETFLEYQTKYNKELNNAVDAQNKFKSAYKLYDYYDRRISSLRNAKENATDDKKNYYDSEISEARSERSNALGSAEQALTNFSYSLDEMETTLLKGYQKAS